MSDTIYMVDAEGLTSELSHLWATARSRHKTEGSVYERGRASAFDEADHLVRQHLLGPAFSNPWTPAEQVTGWRDDTPVHVAYFYDHEGEWRLVKQECTMADARLYDKDDECKIIVKRRLVLPEPTLPEPDAT